MRARIEPGLFYPATRYVEALAMRATLAEEWLAACLGCADLAFIPAIPVPVPTIAATTEGTPADVARAIASVTHCTRGINYLGLPGASVPCGFDSAGLPIGFQLVGRPYAETTILNAAAAYQDTDELFRIDSWVQVMLGQGVTPASHHPIPRMMATPQLEEALGNLRAGIAAQVSRMPSQRDFIASYCAAAA